MTGIQGTEATASQVTAGAIKDTTGAQLISKTLDKMNTAQTLSGPKVDDGYQFRKDVLNASGIGTMLNKTV